MPELRNCVITGGGLAGVAAAYWAARQNAALRVILLEKGPELAGWVRRLGKNPVLLGSVGSVVDGSPDSYPRGPVAAERMLAKWPPGACRGWLESAGVTLADGPGDTFHAPDPREFQQQLHDLLKDAGVELHVNYAVESVARQPDGGFRIWSKGGDPVTGDRILFATGGERNHGLKLAGELGADVDSPVAAYVRLRLAGPRLGERLGPLHREARLRCVKTGAAATGMVSLSARGLEGPVVSNLSAGLCGTWKQTGYQFRLELDWLPGFSGASVRNELDSRTRRGTRRPIGEDPLFGFSDRQWRSFLELARVDPQLAWPRLRTRKLQALVQQLKNSQIAISGMGLPAGERAWAGGVRLDSLHLESGESLSHPGVYFAGEMLDILGLPGGPQLNIAWASAYLAGSAMAL